MVVLIAPFDPSVLYFIRKELTLVNISRIEILAYPNDDLSDLQGYFGEKLSQIVVNGFEDALMKVTQHISSSKSSYLVLLTQTSTIELTVALISSFTLIRKKDVTFVLYTRNERRIIDSRLLAPLQLNEKELAILKAMSEGKYKVKDLAESSQTSISTASRVKKKLEDEGYIQPNGDSHKITLKGRVALSTLINQDSKLTTQRVSERRKGLKSKSVNRSKRG